jgi:hypothetical protein
VLLGQRWLDGLETAAGCCFAFCVISRKNPARRELLIYFGFERERGVLATLHLAWERKELNQWLASSGRKKDQRKGSSTVKGTGACCLDGQRTVKKRELSGGCSTTDRRGEELKVVAAEFGEEQITRLACCGGEKRGKKIERGDCWRGIAAGCGLGTNKMLVVLICSLGEKKEQKGMQVCNYGFGGAQDKGEFL